jgi:Ca2+-binding RTX toxin-like protein
MAAEGTCILASAGVPVITGSDGDDFISLYGGKGTQTVHGGAGTDTVCLDRAPLSFTIETDGAMGYILLGANETIRLDSIEAIEIAGQRFSIASASAANGGEGDDTLVWMGARHHISGGDGTDTLAMGGELGAENSAFARASDGAWHVTIGDREVTIAGIEKFTFGGLTVDLAADGDTLLQHTSHHATPGPDALVGNDLGYPLRGGAGEDTLEGRGGDDALYGDAGDDTAIYRGNRADYDIRYEDRLGTELGRALVHDSVDARDGADILESVEWLQFADGTFKLQDVAAKPEPTDKAHSLFWTLQGTEGDDHLSLYGGKAAHAVHGGDGTDTLRLEYGNLQDYTLAADGVSGYLLHTPKGTVQIDGIEYLEIDRQPIEMRAAVGNTGGSSDDTLIWFGGHNRITGGAGQDTLVIGRTLGVDDSSFSRAADGSWLIRMGGREVTITGIERLAFVDRTIDLADEGALLLQPTVHAATDGPDALLGNDLGYALRAGAGNDTLEGRGGNDSLYGGKGDDTAIYRGNRADYEVLFDPMWYSTTVRDLRDGRDGTDVLGSIEWLRFADGTFKLDDIVTRVERPELDMGPTLFITVFEADTTLTLGDSSFIGAGEAVGGRPHDSGWVSTTAYEPSQPATAELIGVGSIHGALWNPCCEP